MSRFAGGGGARNGAGFSADKSPHENTGTGGDSAWGGSFEDEIKQDSPLYANGYRRGLLAMANHGANTNSSQFFIMHQDYPLQPNYVIFAKVISGMEVVDALAYTPVTMGMDGGMSQPLTPPKIVKITVKP